MKVPLKKGLLILLCFHSIDIICDGLLLNQSVDRPHPHRFCLSLPRLVVSINRSYTVRHLRRSLRRNADVASDPDDDSKASVSWASQGSTSSRRLVPSRISKSGTFTNSSTRDASAPGISHRGALTRYRRCSVSPQVFWRRVPWRDARHRNVEGGQQGDIRCVVLFVPVGWLP